MECLQILQFFFEEALLSWVPTPNPKTTGHHNAPSRTQIVSHKQSQSDTNMTQRSGLTPMLTLRLRLAAWN